MSLTCIWVERITDHRSVGYLMFGRVGREVLFVMYWVSRISLASPIAKSQASNQAIAALTGSIRAEHVLTASCTSSSSPQLDS